MAEYQKTNYREIFDAAVKIANKRVGIEEVTEAMEQTIDQPSPQTESFEINRKNLTSICNSQTSNCSFTKDSTPLQDTDLSNQCMEHKMSTPNNGSANNCDDITNKLLLTPTRKMTLQRSCKRSQTDSKLQQKRGTKKARHNSTEDNHATLDMIDNNVTYSQVTPSNSSSNDESEDELPAVSVSQTPTKGYSSCKFCFAVT